MSNFKYFFIIALIPFSLSSNLFPNKTENHRLYHQMYVLGDSLSDTGGFTGVGTDFVATKYMPLPFSKIQLGNPYYHNTSFSNGPVAVQHLADKLQFNLTAGWKFSAVDGWLKYEHVGNNYAVGDSVAGNDISWVDYLFSNRFNLANQADALIAQHQDLQTNDLTFVESGNNDIKEAIGLNNFYNQETMINNAVNSETQVISRLINNGIGHILVTNVPDFGQVPRFYGTNKQALASSLSGLYNTKWEKAINNLKAIYPGMIKTYDLAASLTNYINIFQNKGLNRSNAIEMNKLKLITSGTLGTKYVNGATPATINDYFFLDDIHPAKWLHEQVGNDLYQLVSQW